MSGWPWPSSETTDKVIPAFVIALQAVEDVTRSKSVDAGNMRYNYADLDAVLEAAKPVLTAQGLAVTQAAAMDGVHALLMHSSGEWLAFPPLQVTTQQNTPQGQGSALTYARRYQMLALLNIATEDDDGKAAAKPRKAAAPATPHNATGEVDGLITAPQMGKLRALYGELGINGAAVQKAETARLLGVASIESHSALTVRQASDVIDQLQRKADAA